MDLVVLARVVLARLEAPSMMRIVWSTFIVLWASAAAAQTVTGADISAERLRPAIDRQGVIDVDAGQVPYAGAYDLSLWLGYAHNPLVLYAIDGDEASRESAVLVHRLGANLVGAYAIFDWLQIGLDLPLALYQSGEDGVTTLDAAGLGDLRLVPKIALLTGVRHGVDLAILPIVTFPTAVPKDNFLGQSGIGFTPTAALSLEIGRVRLAANAGVRLRGDARALDLEVGHELDLRGGVGVRVTDAWEVSGALSGSTALSRPFAEFEETPLELLAAVTRNLTSAWQAFGGAGLGLVAGYGTPDWRVFAGLRYSPRRVDTDGDRILDDADACVDVPEDHDGTTDEDGCPDPDNDGDGIPDTADACRDDAEDKDSFKDDDGCPDPDNDEDGIKDEGDQCRDLAEDKDGVSDEDGCPDKDNDGDGLEDEADGCPDQAEDKDAFQDEDGCPEPDNDRDGFLDGADKCPNEAEVINGVADDDGCPDEGKSKVQLTATKIEITEKVFFKSGKADIEKRSFDLLNQVAAMLKANPQITKIRVEGHTDDRGEDAMNLRLSDERAQSVRAFLVKSGIAEERLLAVGYGETKPISSNKTSTGREVNRRVEFVIVEVDGKPIPPP